MIMMKKTMPTIGYFRKVSVFIFLDSDLIIIASGDIPIFLMIFSTSLTTSSIILTYLPPTKTKKQLSVGVVMMPLSYLLLFFRLIVRMGKSFISFFVPKFTVTHFPTFRFAFIGYFHLMKNSTNFPMLSSLGFNLALQKMKKHFEQYHKHFYRSCSILYLVSSNKTMIKIRYIIVFRFIFGSMKN